jgi:hypothetical protein
MRSKLGTLTLASVALAAVALSTIPAMAATTTTFKVPFSFTVDGKDCPAGIYSVQRDSLSKTVTLQSKNAPRGFIWVAAWAPSDDSNRVTLKFDAEGQTHALRSVQFGPLVTARLDKKTRKIEDVSAQIEPGQ